MAWVTGRIRMKVSDKDKEALEVESSEDANKVPSDRRRKSDWLTGGGTVGTLSTSLLLLHLVTQQGDTLTQHGDAQKDHTRWIHENTQTTQQIARMLEQIQQEFKGDIRRFELKHAGLEKDLRDLMLRQESTNVRMQGMEGRGNAWRRRLRERDLELKAWARSRFQLKPGTENDE